MLLCKGNAVFTLFFYQRVYKGQTMTKLAENGRKGFRTFCAVALDTGRQTMAEKGGEVEK